MRTTNAQALRLMALTLFLSSMLPAVAAHAAEPASPVALKGYCVVCLVKGKTWVKGSPEHAVTYDGLTYQFPSDGVADEFRANPEAYAPALNGDCTVCLVKAQKRVPGSIEFSLFHQGRLFMFPNAETKEAFTAEPAKFAQADLGLDGLCAVCLVKAGKKVPGKAEFTARHQGIRYLFPNDEERAEFLTQPAEYVAQATTALASSAPATGAKSAATTEAEAAAMTISGRAGCAACDHGVHPIGAPEELGLAVNGADGTVYVVEDAHKLYPKIYENRFKGQALQLTGNVIKRDGKFAWVTPKSLKLAE